MGVEPLKQALKVNLQPLCGLPTSLTWVLMSEDNAVVVVVRATGDGPTLVTVNVDLPVSLERTLTESSGLSLDKLVQKQLPAELQHYPNSVFLPVIKRNSGNTVYQRTTDDRLVEYGFKSLLFAKQSAFQYVEIVDTLNFGKLLILDNMANLAESDTVS